MDLFNLSLDGLVPILKFGIFVGAWGLIDSLVGLAATFLEAIPWIVVAALDGLACIFYFAGGVVSRHMPCRQTRTGWLICCIGRSRVVKRRGPRQLYSSFKIQVYRRGGCRRLPVHRIRCHTCAACAGLYVAEKRQKVAQRWLDVVCASDVRVQRRGGGNICICMGCCGRGGTCRGNTERMYMSWCKSQRFDSLQNHDMMSGRDVTQYYGTYVSHHQISHLRFPFGDYHFFMHSPSANLILQHPDLSP